VLASGKDTWDARRERPLLVVTHKFPSGMLPSFQEGPQTNLVPTIICIVPVRVLREDRCTSGAFLCVGMLVAIVIVVGSPVCRGGDRTEEVLVITPKQVSLLVKHLCPKWWKWLGVKLCGFLLGDPERQCWHLEELLIWAPYLNWELWLTPAILAIHEAEIRRITVKNHPANSLRDAISKNPTQK
jgi:hypothetical protein